METITKTYVLTYFAIRFLNNVELKIASDPEIEKNGIKQTKQKVVNARQIHKIYSAFFCFSAFCFAFISIIKLFI